MPFDSFHFVYVSEKVTSIQPTTVENVFFFLFQQRFFGDCLPMELDSSRLSHFLHKVRQVFTGLDDKTGKGNSLEGNPVLKANFNLFRFYHAFYLKICQTLIIIYTICRHFGYPQLFSCLFLKRHDVMIMIPGQLSHFLCLFLVAQFQRHPVSCSNCCSQLRFSLFQNKRIDISIKIHCVALFNQEVCSCQAYYACTQNCYLLVFWNFLREKLFLKNFQSTPISNTKSSSSMTIIMIENFISNQLFFHSNTSLAIRTSSSGKPICVFLSKRSVFELNNVL